ncbi:MAG: hypothetical protein H6712_03360 [Myxococcales bacterium]|nr:hypothetical protein [Myxococcales bacterium]MCB9712864.1 hypothetical protein [Myxococcales bacterium]
MRTRTGTAAALGSLLTMALGSACQAENLGHSPPGDQFFFPAGVLIDPFYEAPPPDGLASDPPDLDAVVLPEIVSQVPGPRYLYVSNGNNDRTYNAGTLMAIDLDAFWRAWYEPYPDGAAALCLERRAAAELALADAPQQLADVDALPEDERDAAREAVYDGLRSVVTAAREACDPRRGRLDPYCGDTRCVLPPGSGVTEDQPCRRLPLLPHVVECDEGPFVVAKAHVGDFATTLAASIETDGGESFARLWLPVRGDPSVTFVDVHDQGSVLAMDCDQGDDPLDPDLCGDSHRLDHLLSNDDLDPLAREPFNALVWEQDEALAGGSDRERLVFVAHSDGSQLTVIDLDGVGRDPEPTIVDLAPLYQVGAGSAGGFGLATRPCFEAGQGPLGALDPEPNVPTLTQGCRRPLVYSSMRFVGQLVSFTASGLDVGAEVEGIVPAAEREGCTIEVNQGCDLADPSTCTAACGSSCVEVYAGPYCATPEQLGLVDADPDDDEDPQGQSCAVQCEPRVRSARPILPSLLFDSSLTSAPVLGDMAFADPRGDQLLVLQTNPGALLSMDTSLTVDGEPRDIPSAPPIEICAEPSRMKIYTERDDAGRPLQRFALITCFRAALVYVVDLEALRVVDAIVVGTGPHDIAIDDAREVAYVINNLEFSVSVIDLGRRRPTRFQELARLGLQDPFSQ